MADNEFIIKLLAMLDQAKSKKQVNADIKALQQTVSKLRLTATLLKGESKSNINQVIRQMEGQLNKIKLQAKFDQKNLKADVDKALQNISFKDINLNVNENKMKIKLQKVIADAKKTVQSNPLTLDVQLKKQKLNNQLTTYISKNTKIRESESLLKQVDSLRNKIAGINDKDSLRNITQEFQLFKSECAATGYQTKSTTDKIRNMLGGFTKLGSVLGLTSMAVSNFQKSLKTIRSNDIILTEISKTSDSTKQELEELGNSAFDMASKFGQLSSDYLTAIQEMNRSGFYNETGKALGELTLLTQAAGDVSAETAQKYLLATNAAYGYAGNVEKLNAVLDGQNTITNKWSVDMQTMAEATEKAASMAANTGVKIDELTAMTGTISARTKEAGTITGTGIKALLVNLQNISSDKIIETLEKANASMTETVNGVEKLRTPIAILKDLAKTYNSLDESDPLKSEITTNIGGKHHANQLSALLSGWADYEKMLVDYSNGAGSAMIEAKKTAESLEGRLNALQNSWDELVNSIVNKGTLKGGISFLDGVLQSAEKLIDTFDLIPVALASATAVMTAKNKDYGITKVFDKDSRKLDLDGNIFGIDFTQIKHFRDAKNAISDWNNELNNGVTDIESFNNATVKNNSQLREYLSTCTDGSASLKGYKSALQAAGVETNSLRLGTILLNTALSFGLGLAIQGVITGISKLSNHIGDTAEKAQSLSNSISNSLSSIADNSKRVKELNERYQELSKGVDIAGNNVKLTSNDYDEYKNIVSQLSEIMPNLTTMFNAQGEKIGFVGGKLKNANEQYKEYIRNSANKFLTDGNENGETADDMIDDWNNKNTKLDFNLIDEIKAGFGGYSKSDIEEIYSSQELLDEYQKLYNMTQEELYNYFDKADRKETGIGYALERFLKIDLDQLKDDEQYINTLRSDLNSYITEYKTSVDSSAKEIQQIAQYMFLNDEDLYNEKLSEESSSYISNIISNLSNKFIKENFTDKDGKLVKAKIQSYVDNLVDSFTGENGDAIATLFSKLFTLDTSELSIDEIKDQVNGYIDQLYTLMKEDGESLEGFKLRIGISEETYIDEDTDTLINNVKSKLESKFRGKVGELSLDELKIAAEKIEVPDGTLLSWDELVSKIKETKKKAEETSKLTFSKAWKGLKSEDKEDLLEYAKAGKLTPDVLKDNDKYADILKSVGDNAELAAQKINKMVSSSEQLASMKTGISSISGALEEKKENLSNKKTKNVGVSSSTLSGFDAEIKGLDSWKEFEKVLGDGKSSMEQCQRAANALATEWVNSNNFLSQLNQTNKDYYISQLNEMGVKNANAVVTSMLAHQEQEEATAKANAQIQSEALAITKNGVTAQTLGEVSALLQEKGATEDVKYSIMQTIAQENIFSNTSLSVEDKIQACQRLAEAFFGAAAAAKYMNDVANGTDYQTAFNNVSKENAPKELAKPINEKPIIKIKTPKIPKTGSKGKSGSKGTKAKETKQEIDWMDRKVTVLNNKLSETQKLYDAIAASMKKIDSSALVKKENANLNDQIKLLKKLRNTYTVQAAKYQAQANKYAKKNLSKDFRNKVKNGAIKGKYSQLVKEYGEKDAKKIQKAIDLYNKASTARQNKADVNKQINDAEINKHQNRADFAQSRIDKASARKELAVYSQKNKFIDNEIKYTKDLYNHQIEIAKLNKDNEEVEKLRAERDKKVLDYQVEQLQNYADEKEAAYNLKDTQASMLTDYKQKNNLSRQAVTELKSQYKYLIDIAKKQGDTVEASRLQLELEQKISDTLQQRIQNVSDDYENRLIGLNRQAQVWNNAISLAEAKGKTINSNFYSALADNADKEVLKRQQELTEAKQEYAKILSENPDFINDPQWYDTIKNINDIADSMEQAKINAAKYKQQAIEANWAIAESAQSAVDSLNDESDSYKNIFGYKDMFDKEGAITKEGTATMVLNVYDIGNHITKIKKYNKEIDKLNELYAKGDISVEVYDEQMQKLKDGVMESTEEIYSLRDAMKSLIEEGLNAELDALNDMIDKIKDNLSQASSLREYQKNIEKQTKNIASLERQLRAKSGDLSESGRATVQKLKVQLEEARSDLEDTEYEKYIEDQERILDELSEDFQDYLDAQLEQVDTLLEGIISAVENGNVNISEIINNVGKTIGVDLSKVMSESLTKFAEIGQNISDAIYEDRANKYTNSANKEYNDASNTPVMNTDENKGKEETVSGNKIPSRLNDTDKKQVEQRLKSYQWLKSKGYSDNDVEKMYKSLDNAQELFTGLQGAYSAMSAEDIFNAYSKEVQKADKSGKDVSGAIAAYKYTEAYKNQAAKEDEAKKRKSDNGMYVEKIIDILANSRPPQDQSEYQTSNIVKYGSQMFASEKGYGNLLSKADAKEVDSYVKKLKDAETGKPMYKTDTPSDILNALTALDNKFKFGLRYAVKDHVRDVKVGSFSKGGFIDTATLSQIAKKNGDDAWVTVKSGEGILSPLDTQNIMELTKSLNRSNMNLSGDLIIADNNKPIPNKNVNASNNMYGDMNLHFDGSDIRDINTFVDCYDNALKHSKKMQKLNGSFVASCLTNDNNAFMRF